MDAGELPSPADKPSADAINLTPKAYFRHLGQRLAQLRMDREMTQADVARALGVSQQSVFAIELGNRRVRVDWVPKLARLYGISADDLLGISSAQPPPKGRISPALIRHAENISRLGRGERRLILKLAEYCVQRRLSR